MQKSTKKGLYISNVEDNIYTYDIRMVESNTPPFLDMAAVHTIGHVFAEFKRNYYLKNIVYFGPMGCRTGFYLLVKGLKHNEVIELTQKAMDFIANFEGEIPGATEKLCWNYLEHDLQKAREYAKDISNVLKHWNEQRLDYNYNV